MHGSVSFVSNLEQLALKASGLGVCSGWHSVRRHTHEVHYRCDSFTSCSGSFDTATTLKIPLELPL